YRSSGRGRRVVVALVVVPDFDAVQVEPDVVGTRGERGRDVMPFPRFPSGHVAASAVGALPLAIHLCARVDDPALMRGVFCNRKEVAVGGCIPEDAVARGRKRW